MRVWCSGLLRPGLWAYCLLVVLGSRLTLLGLGALGRVLNGMSPGWVDLWVQKDAIWYLDIAAHGYAESPYLSGPLMGTGNLAFFPFLPMALRLVGTGVPLGPLAGIGLSTLFLVLAAGLLYQMAETRYGRGAGTWSVAVLVAFPGSFIFSSIMTEAPYLLLTLAACQFAHERWFAAAGVATGLATVTRPLGIILVPCLILDHVLPGRFTRPGPPCWRGITAILAGPLLLVPYLIYLWMQFGDAFTFSSVQTFWWRQPRNPVGVVLEGLLGRDPTNLFSAIMAMVGLCVLALGMRRLSIGELVFAAANLIVPLCSGLMSMPRFVVAQFPIHLILGLTASRSPLARAMLVPAFAMVNGHLMAFWSMGYGTFI